MKDTSVTGHPNLADIYRHQGLFIPYKCPDCSLSFPSQLQLALHSRSCTRESVPVTSSVQSSASPVTSLALAQSWPPLMHHLGLPLVPFPWMDKMQGVPGLPGLSGLSSLSSLGMSGIPGISGLQGITPYKTRMEENPGLSQPVKSFWPFTLQSIRRRDDDATSEEKNDGASLPPKKRNVGVSDNGINSSTTDKPIDYRASTLAASLH